MHRSHALQNLASNAHVARKRAFLVDEVAILSLFWRREAEANGPPVAHRTLRLLPKQSLRANEDRVLLLVRLFVLIHSDAISGRETAACVCLYVRTV